MTPNPLATPDSEIIPHLERDDRGRLSADSSALAALKALHDSPVAQKCAAFENLYQRWRWKSNGEPRRWAGFVLKLGRVPFSIFRSEIAELGIALQESMALNNATKIQAGIGADYLRVSDDLRSLQKFMLKHYPMDMEKAVSLNTPLLEVAKKIMLRENPPEGS
jgi:hypothetical protein